MVLQYIVPSHFGSPERQGQLAVPATHVSGAQVPAVHLRPVPQRSPGLQAQPDEPSGHAEHVPLVH